MNKYFYSLFVKKKVFFTGLECTAKIKSDLVDTRLANESMYVVLQNFSLLILDHSV